MPPFVVVCLPLKLSTWMFIIRFHKEQLKHPNTLPWIAVFTYIRVGSHFEGPFINYSSNSLRIPIFQRWSAVLAKLQAAVVTRSACRISGPR